MCKEYEVLEMTKKEQEAIKTLQEILLMKDYERAHALADQVLCELLTSLGYKEVVGAWEKIRKFYA